MSSIILSPTTQYADIPNVFTKNANSASSQRVLCAGCKLFVGVLGQFHQLNDAAYPSMKGLRLILCQELTEVLTVKQTVNWLKRMKYNPNLADRKGCGCIMIIDANGQLKKRALKGTEGYDALKKAHDMLKKKKEQSDALKIWREKAAAAMDVFNTVNSGRIYSSGQGRR